MKYNGYVEHSGKKACQIKGGSRELTAQLLSTVPPTSYLPGIISYACRSLGNRDGISVTKPVLQKVSSEIKDGLRLDENVIKSY